MVVITPILKCQNCLFDFQQAKYRFVLISVTNDCNNACDYCYLACNNKISKKVISLDTVKKIIEEYCHYLQDFSIEERFLTIIWHGGEPLIIGKEFYEKVLDIQKEHNEKFGVKFTNGIESNGTLLTEEWADFLEKNNFYIGISIDGPEFVHDIHRRNKNHNSSFSRTLKGIEILEKKKIPFSVISVITNKNYTYYKEMLDFFLKFNYLRYADFLPGYDPNGKIEYLSPENYGNFLVSLFDYWISKGGSEKLQIRYFDDIILKVTNQITKNIPVGCEIMGRCGEIQYVTEEGELYPCVTLPQNEDLAMGNFHNENFSDMIKSNNYQNFQSKFNNLSNDCKSCNVFSICKGGCATRRFYHPNKESDGKDYFCLARKRIIKKINTYLSKTKVEILKQKKHNFLWINNRLWMFDIPEEIENQKNIAKLAFGNVLVVGYGLGVVQKYLKDNEKVESVLTVEKFTEVIEECKKTFGEIHGKIEISDFYDYHTNFKFDCIIGDIWQDMSPRNLIDYEKFMKKSKKIIKKNGLILAWGMKYFEKLLEENQNGRRN